MKNEKYFTYFQRPYLPSRNVCDPNTEKERHVEMRLMLDWGQPAGVVQLTAYCWKKIVAVVEDPAWC